MFTNLYEGYATKYTGNPLMGTLANSEDLDEMQHNAAFHQGLQFLLKLKQTFNPGPSMHHNSENSKFNH